MGSQILHLTKKGRLIKERNNLMMTYPLNQQFWSFSGITDSFFIIASAV